MDVFRFQCDRDGRTLALGGEVGGEKGMGGGGGLTEKMPAKRASEGPTVRMYPVLPLFCQHFVSNLHRFLVRSKHSPNVATSKGETSEGCPHLALACA
jgi:hypothetical protein